MLYRQIIALLYWDLQNTPTQSEHHAEFLNVKSGGRWSNRSNRGRFILAATFLSKMMERQHKKSSSFPLGDECREISYANLFCHTGTSFSVGMNECEHVTRTPGILRAVWIFSRRNVYVCVFKLLCVPRMRSMQTCLSAGQWVKDCGFCSTFRQ